MFTVKMEMKKSEEEEFMTSCHVAESKQALKPNMTSVSRLSVVPRGHRSSQDLTYSRPTRSRAESFPLQPR